MRPDRDPSFLALRIDSDPAKVAEVRRALEDYCRRAGFEDKACDEMGLCINEALANVICHAYHGQAGRPIEISARMDEDRLRLMIRDWGCGENPAAKLQCQHDPLMPGGLGMVCLRQLLDKVVFMPMPDGMLLMMERKCKHNNG